MSTLLLFIFLIGAYLSSGNIAEDEHIALIDFNLQRQKVSDSTLKIVTYNIGYLSGMLNNRPLKRDQVFLMKTSVWQKI